MADYIHDPKPGHFYPTQNPMIEVHLGEHSRANARPELGKARKRHKTLTVELSGDLYAYLLTSSEENERTLAQEVRYWLKKATGIK